MDENALARLRDETLAELKELVDNLRGNVTQMGTADLAMNRAFEVLIDSDVTVAQMTALVMKLVDGIGRHVLQIPDAAGDAAERVERTLHLIRGDVDDDR